MPDKELQSTGVSYESLVEQYGDMVTRLCYLRLSEVADTEDCWQNVFLTLYRNPNMWNKSSRELRRWLVTVTLNECRDFSRKLFHRRHEDIDALIFPFQEDFDRSMITAVKSLPVKYSNVIYLHYYEGYGTREIAEILHRNENTVKSQLKRGREMLKGVLEDG